MEWDVIDDKICCLIFIKNHIINNQHVGTSVHEVINLGIEKDEGSIKMKMSNIAYYCKSKGIKTNSKISPLDNNSIQAQEQFELVKDFSLIEIFKELHRIKKN
ncbi:MAG TPA: hypothetical protein DEP70_00300 [Acholeplasmataceae bacterium]|nr:hypothetical protein [Acholeplasmataceae bacterium]